MLTTAYFFFMDESDHQKSATTAICALLHQICDQKPVLLCETPKTFDSHGPQLMQEFLILWRILLDISRSAEDSHTICVLNGLDKCYEKDQRDPIHAFNRMRTTKEVQGGFLKSLVTTRPYGNITEQLYICTRRLASDDNTESIA